MCLLIFHVRKGTDSSFEQERKDAIKLSTWKSALKGHNRVVCSADLVAYLDFHMPGWRDGRTRIPRTSSEDDALHHDVNTDERIGQSTTNTTGEASSKDLLTIAEGIVKRYKERGNILPSLTTECRRDPSRAQEYRDASKLHFWKIHTEKKLRPEVLNYLNSKMPGWRKSTSQPSGKPDDTDVSRHMHPFQLLLQQAKELVNRCRQRREKGLPLLPRHLPGRQQTPDLVLEKRDARKLIEWKKLMFTLNHAETEKSDGYGKSTLIEFRSYLDKTLLGWRHIPEPSSVKLKSYGREQLLNPTFFQCTSSNSSSLSSSSESCLGVVADDIHPKKRKCRNSTTPNMKKFKGDNNMYTASQSTFPQGKAEQDGVSALLQLSNNDYSCGSRNSAMHAHDEASRTDRYVSKESWKNGQ